MPEEMKQVPIDLSHVFELLSNKKNDILDIDYSNDNDSYPTVRAVKNYVDDLQTILDSKASIDSVNNLGSALSSNLNTIYSFINHVTTDKVYDKGNLTNIGTTPHSTQELVNSKIDSQLGTINSKLDKDISGKENTSNKVTSLSSSSTDTQYPSAKCVYDTVDIVDDKVSVVYNPVSIIDTSDNLYDADRWTESGTMTIARTSKNKVIGGGGSENGYVIYNGNISNLDNYDITLNLKANRTGTNVYINDNNIGTLPTSQTSILFKKRDGVVKVVYNNNQYNASAVKFMSSNAMSMTRYTIDVVLYQGMIYDVINSIPSKTSDLTNDGADGTNVFVANNDNRLYDARTPRSHTHGQITDIGKITSSAVTVESDDNIVITDASDTSKLKRVVNLLATHIKDSNTHSNIGTSASATQGAINTAIDTALGGKASSTDLSNGLQHIGGYTIHTVYSVGGTASAYAITEGLLYAQQTPVFFLVKNNIGDNEANATLRYYPNGNDITIMDTFSNNNLSPIQQGVWKKGAWALFFCIGNNMVQLRAIFYDSSDIDKKILDLSENIDGKVFDLSELELSYNDLTDKPTIPSASSTAPLGIRVNTSSTTGSSTEYARADHQHTLTQFKCNGTAGSDGYIKVFQIKINGTYQDSPISFSLMQRGTKQSADVNIRFANENNNDPALDSFTFNGNNIGNNGEYYLYKESASTWSFIVRKWDTHDVINIYNMSTTNGSIAITSLNTQVSELPNGCIPASMVKNDLFFKTKNGSTQNYINLFEIRPTGDYQSKSITFEIVRNTKPTPIYVSVRLTNVTLASNTYAPQTIYAWGTSDTPVYIRKEANNVFNVIVFHTANEEISICNMNNPNQSVKITPLGTVYGTDAPATSGDNQVWTHTYTAGGTPFGTGTNNVIRGNDSRLSDARNPKSTKISAGSDLNTYTTTGFYYNNANTDCATITPLPRPNQAFFLQVEDWGTSNYTKQTITHYNPVKTYERIRNAGTWSDWYELQHNDGTGGENLLRTEPNNEGNSGVAYTIADETFHNDKVYYRNETSQDTTKYSGWTWAIPKTEFDYGDVFTLSFYAKGTSNAEIRTYFAGERGYISNRRISSNSDVDNNVSSYGDGATRFHLTSDWKRYYVTYQLHTTATTPTQNKSIHIRTLGASTDIEFYISNVKLERGYYATDYDRRTRDNEPLYFPTEVSLPTTTTSGNRRKFIHPPYKFKNIPNWTVEGEIKVTGNSARFELHKTDDTNLKNFIAVGKNGSGVLAYWWGTSSSAESSKTYSASDIAVDTWYPFRISRMGNNVLFMFNNGYKHEVATTYFNTFEDIEPSIFGYGTSGASVRNLKITPLEPVHPLSPSSSVCTNAQGIITTESKNNHAHSDTQLNWNGDATNNSISPLLMAMDSEFGANRLAYFPSSRIKVEYSTDGGSTWNELTTGNYSEANKTKLVTTASQYMFLGNNSTTDYSKNSLRITFDVGDMNADSILYLVTRKIALFTGTANSTGFTCRIQTQTYAQYNTNSETFSNYGSAFTLGGWSGWNTAPLDVILGGYKSSNQTNSSSGRIKALRLLFTQTGGTGNGFVAKVRLYGETAHKTASQYANNNHIYTINENQDATFPSKIIKEGGTSSQFLMANGDVQNKVTSWSNTPSDVNIPSEKLVKTEINSIQETIGSNSPQIMKVEYIERQYQNTSGRQLVIQVTCDVPITRRNIVANSNDGANTSINTLSGSDNMMICTFGIYDANESDTFNITLKNNNGVITDTYSFNYTFSGNNNYWVDTGYVNNSYSIRNEIDSLKNGLANILQYKKVASFQDNKIRVFANSFSGCIFINGTFTVAANNVTTLCTIPSQYKPPNPITLPCNESQTTYNYISIWTTDGKVNLRNRGSGTSVSAYNIVYYPLRDTIGV